MRRTFLTRASAVLLAAMLCQQAAAIAPGGSPAHSSCTFDVPPTNCAACIREHSSCNWCTDEAFNDQRRGPQFRCGTREELRHRGCKSVESPASTVEVMVNKSLSDNIQIQPQNITLRARIQEPIRLEFTFKQAVNYPVDLYILSDKSHSMRDFLHSVANMSERIQQTLHELTHNWRIGVGFFVDKPLFPYVQPNPSRSPCDTLALGESCIDTFSYIHAMNLSQNTTELKNVTAAKSISANLDAPEGSLDALLQAVVCRSQVGWRDNSRKVVLLAVDGGFHMAGDGRFGGIIEPFPETQCHLEVGRNKLNMNGSLEYVNATRYDYPSIGQVAKVLSDAKVSVIFALKSLSYLSLYEQLKDALPVITEVDLVTNDNVLELIKKNYRSIAETVEFRANDPGNWLNLTSEIRCPGESAFRLGTRCDKVPLGGTVEFRATLRLTRCAPRPVELLEFASSTSQDKLYVQIQSLCSCPECEAKANRLDRVTKCQSNGHLECGVCSCHGNYSGDSCNCSSLEGLKMDGCRDSSMGPVCTLRGRCVCNRCVCSEPHYYGKYCELDRHSCRNSWDTQEVCGGPSRGRCDGKGSCVCNDGYSEKDCSCSLYNKKNPDCQSRMEQYKNMQCSNHGTCICGRCVCEAMYSSDPHCDTRGGSTGSLCPDPGLQACVECAYAHRELPAEEMHAKCNCTLREESVWVDKARIQFIPQRDIIGEKSICVITKSNGCSLLYGYQIGDNALGGKSFRNMSLFIDNQMSCPERVTPVTLVLIVVAAVVIIGIVILVIWKILVTISDKRELADFIQSQSEAKHATGENPLFQDPTITVKNPLFEGRKAS